MLNMFWTLIHPSSGACDFSIVSPHWLCVLVSMCVGILVWLHCRLKHWSVSACHTDTIDIYKEQQWTAEIKRLTLWIIHNIWKQYNKVLSKISVCCFLKIVRKFTVLPRAIHLGHYILLPQIRGFLEKLRGFQIVKIFPKFYVTWRFNTCPYPEPARSIQYPHILLPEDPS